MQITYALKYLPTSEISPTYVSDYREKLMMSLSSARKLAAETIQKAQVKYKSYYDRNVRETELKVEDRILVYFP